METLNENKMIAKFMNSNNSNIKYDENFNELIPVIDKIYSMGYEFEIRYDETYFKDPSEAEIISSSFGYGVLLNTFNAVVEFINWHNNY
jgi:hypothetical protein